MRWQPFGLIAILLIIVIAVVLSKPAQPEDIAKKYYKALESGNFAKAYELLYIPEQDKEFLTKENFIKQQKTIEENEGKITEFTLDTMERTNNFNEGLLEVFGDDEDKQQYGKDRYREYEVVVCREKSQPNKDCLKVVNKSEKKKPIWQINSDYLIEYRRINTLSGLDVKIDGTDITESDKEGGYDFAYFTGLPCKIQITGETIKPQEIESDETIITIKDFEHQEELKQELEKVIQSFNNADVKACVEKDPSYYKPFVSADLYKDLQSQIERMKEKDYFIELELDEIEYNEIKFDKNINKVLFHVKEVWSSTYIYSDGTKDTHEPHTIKWVYKLYKGGDDKWYIEDHYEDFGLW